MVQIELEGLHKQVEDQLNYADISAALESQSDAISYTLQHLISDIQNYKGTGTISLSTETLAGLSVLQQISEQASIADQDILMPNKSLSLQAVIERKTKVRQLQLLYYKAKQALGIG